MKVLSLFIIGILLLVAIPNNSTAQSNDTTITVKVKGITCASDLKTISTNVEKVEGVNSCKVSKQGATTSFEVIFNPLEATKKDIQLAIEETGGCQNPADRPYKVKNK